MEFERLVLYIDILGFSEKIKEENFLKENIQNLEILFKKQNSSQKFTSNPDGSHTLEIESSMFSDSFLISIPSKDNPALYSKLPERFRNQNPSLTFFIYYTNQIQEDILLKFGCLSRGIIHVGELVHNRHFIIGKAFLDVYKFEKELKNPAIYLSKKIQERYENEIKEELKKDPRHTFYRKDENERIYI